MNSPRTGQPDSLEGEFQTELHIPVGARPNERIAGGDIRRGGRATEVSGRGWIDSAKISVRCVVRIGEGLAVEEVKGLDAELLSVAFLEREVLERGEIHGPEARVAEQVAGPVQVSTPRPWQMAYTSRAQND